MIEIRGLKKTYINRNGTQSRGIEELSFKLPENGFVFVLGKSGSGKSTLLNLLGDLDKPTSGDILINGKSLYQLSPQERREYKASFCGFIFQDYRLINELNVKENILLSLDIINDIYNKDNRLKEVLHKVDLDGYENKMVNELSGGEKQRVAIARALIKNPKLILCDEPTGNLDKKTSTQILDLLKEISNDCLIFMVSHDEPSSIEYATRRIILEEGKIKKDEARPNGYKNHCYIENDIIFLPFNRNLNDEEKALINEKIRSKDNIKFKQINNGFMDFDNVINDKNFSKTLQNSTKIEKTLKNRLLKKFFNKGLIMSSLNSLLFALLTILLILVQTFLHFDSSKIILDNIDLKNQQNVVISKFNKIDDENQMTISEFSDEEIDELVGDKKYYPCINFSQSFSLIKHFALSSNGYNRGSRVIPNSNNFYNSVFYNTAIVDEEYLANTFNNGNEIEVLAGELFDSKHPSGIIVPDYFIDSVNDEKDMDIPYSDYIGPFGRQESTRKFYISAIINTNYKKKHEKLLNNYQKLKSGNFDKEETEDFFNSAEYETYYRNVYNGELSTVYTLNKNFLEDIKGDITNIKYAPLGGCYLYSEENSSVSLKIPRENFGFIDSALKNNEISIPSTLVDTLGPLFGTSNIKGKTLKIVKKERNSSDGKVIKEIEVVIKDIISWNDYHISSDLAKAINEASYFKGGILVPLDQDISNVLQVANDKNYDIYDVNSNVYTLVYKTLKLYRSTFELVQYIVIALLLIYFSLNSIKTIKEYRYQIGVFKSLGMDDFTISYIFSGKNLIFSFISIILISILSYPFLYLANVLLISSYGKFMAQTLPYLNIFYFHPIIFVINYIFVLFIVFLCSILPLLSLKRITPAKIVNNREDWYDWSQKSKENIYLQR